LALMARLPEHPFVAQAAWFKFVRWSRVLGNGQDLNQILLITEFPNERDDEFATMHALRAG
jgi:hypothetical protein